MNDLFDIPESKSPRLLWMERHNIRTDFKADATNDDDQPIPWMAFIGEADPRFPHAWGTTELEAIANLAMQLKIRLWNEEGRA